MAAHQLQALQTWAAMETLWQNAENSVDKLHVRVAGQLVRKRKLSKALIFGDIKLADDALLEVMIRRTDGILTADDIKQINWQVHLGDSVTCEGLLERKDQEPGHEHEYLLAIHTIHVDDLWTESHPGEFFDHTQFMRYHTQDQPVASTSEAAPADQGEAENNEANDMNESSQSQKLLSSHREQVEAKAQTRNYTNMVTIQGFNACKYYFCGAVIDCFRGDKCHFWHGKEEEREKNRQEWLRKRLAQKRELATLADDSWDPHEKQLKAQRAKLFCDWLVEQVGESLMSQGSGVVDVAGGKGAIPVELWIKRGIPTTLIDPRPMKPSKKYKKLIAKSGRPMAPQLLMMLDDSTMEEHKQLFENCSMLLGMHPDEATEGIVDAALALNKPFAIVPCCVMSRLFPNRQTRTGQPVENYDQFITYLLEKSDKIQRAFLPFTGRNQVLYCWDP